MALMQIGYHLRLGAPALFAFTSEPAQLVTTARYVPGPSVWGALAHRWIDTHPAVASPHRHPDFRRLFLRGDLCVLNAYPVEPHDPTRRTLPLPLSVMVFKSGPSGPPREARDLAWEAQPPDEPMRVLSGFGRVEADTVYQTEARRSLSYHITRVRGRGRPTAEEGDLFVYQSLDPGQEFRGIILGDQADLDELRDLVVGAPLVLGRSRSAQYGASALLELDPSGSAAFMPEALAAPAPDGRLVVTLTSHVVPLDADGTGRPVFPYDQFAQLLAQAGASARSDAPLTGDLLRETLQTKAFTSDEVIGGFSAVWGLPRPQVRALAPGSVWVFEGIVAPAAALAATMESSLGARIGEGFGRFVLNWHGTGPIRREATWRQVPVRQPQGPPPRLFQEIVRSTTLARWEDEMRRRAAEHAGEFADRQGWPSGALLSRLTDLVRPLASIDSQSATLLDPLKDLAKQQLRARRAPVWGRTVTLLDLFEDALNPASAFNPDSHHPLWQLQSEATLTAYEPSRTDQKIAARLTRLYLLTFLKVLEERRRQWLTEQRRQPPRSEVTP